MRSSHGYQHEMLIWPIPVHPAIERIFGKPVKRYKLFQRRTPPALDDLLIRDVSEARSQQ